MESRVGEFLFCLRASRLQDAKLSRSLRRVLEKSGLPDTGVALDDEHAASSPPSRPEETVERLALPASAQQFQCRAFPLRAVRSAEPCLAIRSRTRESGDANRAGPG